MKPQQKHRAILLVSFLVILAQNFGSTSAFCQDGNNEDGFCIPISECPSLLRIYMTKPYSKEDLSFLKNSQCGVAQDKTALVCCSNQANEANTETYKSCVDPKHQQGFCKPIIQCPRLHKMLRTKPISLESKKYLKESQCGLTYSLMPLVCCTEPEPEVTTASPTLNTAKAHIKYFESSSSEEEEEDVTKKGNIITIATTTEEPPISNREQNKLYSLFLGHPHGKPFGAMTFTDNSSISVDYDALSGLFLHPEVAERKIVTVSIIGAFRKGKSFFMDYCLRFMYANYKSVNNMNNTLNSKHNWMGSSNEPLTGFSWKSGSTRHTTGVVIWSDIFLYDHVVKGKEEKIAILLMDTQGLFDTKSSPADNSRIFALGTLLSSVQIFNLNDVIQEDQLEYLQLATDYAKFVTSDSGEQNKNKPFQNLLFLMRDWVHVNNFEYGLRGGDLYIADVLKIQEYQSPALKSVRQYIKQSFDEVSCFLMPHPGFKILMDANYDGRYSELNDKFVSNLKALLEWLFRPENLKKKQILGREVIGKSFHKYAKTYFETFQSPNVPLISSVYEATIQSQLSEFVDESIDKYRNAMQFYEDYTQPNFIQTLEAGHEYVRKMAILTFQGKNKMGSEENEQQFLEMLEKQIDSYYKKWKTNVLSTYNKMVEIAKQSEKELKAKQKKVQDDFKAKNDKLKLEKESLDKEIKERQLKAEQDINLKEKDKKAAIKKIQDEMITKQRLSEVSRVQLINDQKLENERIQKESERKAKKVAEDFKQLQVKQQAQQKEIEAQLKRDRDSQVEQAQEKARENAEQNRLREQRMQSDCDLRVKYLIDEIASLKQQLSSSRERERQAINQLTDVNQQLYAARNQGSSVGTKIKNGVCNIFSTLRLGKC